MLETAEKKNKKEPITYIRMGMENIDQLEEQEAFDVVTSSLAVHT